MSLNYARELLPADPIRGLSQDAVADAEAAFDGSFYWYGMWSAAGAARLRAVLDQVRSVLSAGLGRDVALHALMGGLARLERDGHGEYSDTVVRESIIAELELDCEDAAVPAFTDAEVNEVALFLACRAGESAARATLSAATGL